MAFDLELMLSARVTVSALHSYDLKDNDYMYCSKRTLTSLNVNGWEVLLLSAEKGLNLPDRCW